MNAKATINEIIVVEGKTDSQKLKKLFNVETIETNGSEISDSTIELIKKASIKKEIILFFDPDYQGERIRKKIQNNLKKCKNAFIKKSDILLNSKKIGIAEASDESIIKALSLVTTFNINSNYSLSWNEYLSLNVNSKQKRILLTNKIGISYCNNKQLFKRINMLGLTLHDLKPIIEEVSND